MPTPLPPFDFDLLRSFVAVVDTGGFTRAAGRLGRTQSTVSLQIKRLEDAVGHRVFIRDRREPQLTAQGEVLLAYARRILRIADEARVRLTEPDVGGVVRLGTPEDFATVHLPGVLSRFARSHPQVSLEAHCDFTANLLDGFAKGQFDLVLCKRDPQTAADGQSVWREPLVWVGAEHADLSAEAAVPLVLAPNPDIHRRRAIKALDDAGRPWRVVYTSPSLSGIQAAVRAGLGVTVLPKEMVSPGLAILGPDHALPTLEDTEIILLKATSPLSKAVDMLAEHIVRSLETGT